MSVVLLILKIIGIVLAALLAVLVLLLLAILFYPVGYHVAGRFEEERQLKIKLHWLLHMIRFRYNLEGESQTAQVWILFIPIQLYPPKEKKGHRKRAAAKRQKEPSHQPEWQDAPQEDTLPLKVETDIPQEDEKELYTSDADGYSDWISRIQNRLKALREFFATLLQRLRHVKENISKIQELVTDEANQAAVRLLFGEGKKLLVHYRPRKLTADISYGLGDPALTGQVLGVLSMIPFLYREKVQIVPDFETEQAMLEGRLAAAGHIRFVHLLRSGVHIWKDDNCRTILSKWKN